jgi:hypothetical protein
MARVEKRASEHNWVHWHTAYDDPRTTLSRRLAVVRDRLADALDAAPPGPVRLVSVCAGQGHDVFGVLPVHARRADVSALLVELDPDNARAAAARAEQEGLPGVRVLCRDASLTDSYAGAVPADVILVCGVFGNVSDADVAGTVAALPSLAARDATVIWTRHRGDPDVVPDIQRWFAGAGFDQVWLSDRSQGYGVGVHRFTGEPRPLVRGQRLFTFVGPEGELVPHADA